MASRLFWRSRDSSSGNANHRRRAHFLGARSCRTICDHPPKLLLIYCRCLFSESPGLSFGPASVLISQLGPSCNLQRASKMKWRQIRHRNVKETRWRSGRSSSSFTFLTFFSFWRCVCLLLTRFCIMQANVLYFLHTFVLRGNLSIFASLADCELDNSPLPIRMLFSGL